MGLAGYPLQEYGGLIFAYLGGGVRRRIRFATKGRFRRSRASDVRPRREVALQLVPASRKLTGRYARQFCSSLGDSWALRRACCRDDAPKLEYLETEAGIRQIATRSKNSVRVSDWTFPNKNHIVVPGIQEGDPWIDVGHWIVPNDDETSTRFIIYSIPSVSPEADRRIVEYFEKFGDYNPADHHDDLFLHKKVPDDVMLQLTSAQDYVAAVGQGSDCGPDK